MYPQGSISISFSIINRETNRQECCFGCNSSPHLRGDQGRRKGRPLLRSVHLSPRGKRWGCSRCRFKGHLLVWLLQMTVVSRIDRRRGFWDLASVDSFFLHSSCDSWTNLAAGGYWGRVCRLSGTASLVVMSARHVNICPINQKICPKLLFLIESNTHALTKCYPLVGYCIYCFPGKMQSKLKLANVVLELYRFDFVCWYKRLRGVYLPARFISLPVTYLHCLVVYSLHLIMLLG